MKLTSKKSGQSFLSRLIINGLLLYVVVWLYSPGYIDSLNSWWDIVMSFLTASLIFSVLNAILRPILIMLALPVVFLSLGLFTLIINGIIVYITAAFIPNLALDLGDAILAGIIISLANYLITNLFWKGKK